MTQESNTPDQPDVESALQRLDRRRAVIRDRVRAVSDGDATGLYLFGRPGTGKSRTVRAKLRDLEAREVYHTGQLTPLGLFDLMAKHPGDVLVLDDVGALLRQPVAVRLLLAALGPPTGRDGQRLVTYQRQGQDETVPFTGGVILISNLTLHPTGLIPAFQSRVETIEFDPPDAEVQGLALDLVREGWGRGDDGEPRVDAASATEVVAHVIAEAGRRGLRPDLRVFEQALMTYARWKEGKTETH